MFLLDLRIGKNTKVGLHSFMGREVREALRPVKNTLRPVLEPVKDALRPAKHALLGHYRHHHAHRSDTPQSLASRARVENTPTTAA